ncbi:MAG: TrmH family RNA methyltransferase [Anaerolineales bacterium]|nr:TrmH family RNA methyltransferase [Anaerolineales bacterium]
MDFRLKRYQKDFEHSYTFGVFPTLELVERRPEQVLGVVVHPKGLQNQGVLKLQAHCARLGLPFEVQERTLERLGGRENDYVIGVLRKYQAALAPQADHLVLVNPGSLGNLGTILRTMLGFGMHNLAIIEPAADLFHPEVLRAAMGALFQLNFEHYPTFNAYQQAQPRSFYPLMTDGAVSLPQARFEHPASLVFGNESSGLDPTFRQLGTSIRIPQSHAIDSLNLAISVGVVLYEWAKVNQ